MIENQKTITTWQNETFGDTTPFLALCRAQKEWVELQLAAMRQDWKSVAEELPDVLITIYRVAELLHVNLHEAVDAKMETNRLREWITDGNGNGQHK
jgi:NTP pyrophosphatase (non-canonical NTP hydrolase)